MAIKTQKTAEEEILAAEDAKYGSLNQGDTFEADGVGSMTVTELAYGGYKYVYDNVTGERSLCNENMLPAQLKKKRADGSRVFTTAPTGIVPVRGKIKCLLHADAPDRKHYADIGFSECRKDNLVSDKSLKDHMKHRHSAEWATILEERADADKREDREYQRTILEQIAKNNS